MNTIQRAGYAMNTKESSFTTYLHVKPLFGSFVKTVVYAIVKAFPLLTKAILNGLLSMSIMNYGGKNNDQNASFKAVICTRY